MQLFPFSDRQKTQSDLSIHRPSMLRFVLTPLTIQERCRIVRDQLKQLQYEHGQLLSLTGEQNGNENMEELQVEPGYELPRQLAEEKPTKEPKVERKSEEEVELASLNLLQDTRTLERKMSVCNQELEIETFELQVEQQYHEMLNTKIQACEQQTGNGTRARELRNKVDEIKVLISRLSDENTNLAGYILRKRRKLVGRYFIVLKCVLSISWLTFVKYGMNKH